MRRLTISFLSLVLVSGWWLGQSGNVLAATYCWKEDYLTGGTQCVVDNGGMVDCSFSDTRRFSASDCNAGSEITPQQVFCKRINPGASDAVCGSFTGVCPAGYSSTTYATKEECEQNAAGVQEQKWCQTSNNTASCCTKINVTVGGTCASQNASLNPSYNNTPYATEAECKSACHKEPTQHWCLVKQSGVANDDVPPQCEPVSLSEGQSCTPPHRYEPTAYKTQQECNDAAYGRAGGDPKDPSSIDLTNPGSAGEWLRGMNPLQISVCDPLTIGCVMSYIINSIVFPLSGLFLFLMIVWGGYQMVNGSLMGSQNTIQRGQQRIRGAFLGFLMLAAVFWLWKLIEALTGIQIT